MQIHQIAGQKASVYEGGIENGGNGPTGTTGSGVIKSVCVNVKQEKSILSTEDIPLLANYVSYPSTRNVDQVVDRFQQKSFKDPDTGEILMYNLYVPEAYDPEKGFPGMNASVAVWEAQGTTVAKNMWNARWTEEEYRQAVAAMRASGCSIHYTVFSRGTTWDGNPAEESPNKHNSSMHFAYDIEGVRDWLFEQVLGEQHP